MPEIKKTWIPSSYAPHTKKCGSGFATVVTISVDCERAGFIFTVVGIGYLSDATHDSRGDKLHKWHDEMTTWQSTGLTAFKNQRYTILALPVPAPPGPPPPGTPMVGTASTITPAEFGESSFDVRSLHWWWLLGWCCWLLPEATASAGAGAVATAAGCLT